MIIRQKYMDRLIKIKENGQVKILTGVRRCGKSTLLFQLREHFINNGIDEKCIGYIDFEKSKYNELKDGDKLESFVEKLCINGRAILFIDEVQEINNWAKVISSVWSTFEVDIYVTGSNDRIFMGGHMVYLSGRYTTVNIYPLSFNEMYNHLNRENNKRDSLSVYYELIDGSFPKYVIESDEEEKDGMLKDLYKSIFIKDVIEKGKLIDEEKFNNVARFLFDNIASHTSPKKIADTMKSIGIAVSDMTIKSYLRLICNSYLLYRCPRYDIAGKKMLYTNGKYYAVDLGLQKTIANNDQKRAGQKFENFIYLELLKANYDVVCLIVNREYEIDFMARRGKKTFYVQACLSVIDENTLEREERPFRYTKDNFPKFIVTLDDFSPESKYFTHMNFVDFIKMINER